MVLIFLLVCIVYGIKFYGLMVAGTKGKLLKRIKKLITLHIHKNTPLTKSDLNILNKNIRVTLNAAEHFDEHHVNSPGWAQVRAEIIHKIFMPKIESMHRSIEVYDRYFAAKLLYYHMDEAHIPIVITLIKDPVLLIAIEAMAIGFKYTSASIINASIDEFSHKRRIRQSMLADVASGNGDLVKKIIIERLESESEAFAKAFCYRLLLRMNATHHLPKDLRDDIESDTLELTLAALNYAAHNAESCDLIPAYLNAPQWQVRAAAAKLIGITKNETCLDELEKLLGDPEWWVRVRAAESLRKLGQAGIAILKAQSADKDKFAYDVACEALLAI
ncbi:MAG: HEAT repeat domain-containing protein [Gammaproteobacteria bacterium]